MEEDSLTVVDGPFPTIHKLHHIDGLLPSTKANYQIEHAANVSTVHVRHQQLCNDSAWITNVEGPSLQTCKFSRVASSAYELYHDLNPCLVLPYEYSEWDIHKMLLQISCQAPTIVPPAVASHGITTDNWKISRLR